MIISVSTPPTQVSWDFTENVWHWRLDKFFPLRPVVLRKGAPFYAELSGRPIGGRAVLKGPDFFFVKDRP